MSRFGTSNIQTLCGRKMVELERPTGPIVMIKLSTRVRGGGIYANGDVSNGRPKTVSHGLRKSMATIDQISHK
jgi:predicted outer membrane repeat protein